MNGKTISSSLSANCLLERHLAVFFLLTLHVGCSGGDSGVTGSSLPDVTILPGDSVPPVIVLSGKESIEIVVDTLYIDPGATATDNVDGDLSNRILVSSQLDSALPGEYTIHYNVSDQANNAATQVSRTITVVTPMSVKSVYGPAGFVEIESGVNGFADIIDSGDRFSRDHDVAGDIDGDGVVDLVVGARSDDDGATDAGAVYILFMNSDNTVKAHQKISNFEGGFTDVLLEGNFFGYGVASIGDYDGDDVPDIAATAPNQANQALYIMHLNTDGTVKSMIKNVGIPGTGLTAAGDLNGDGKVDLISGEPSAAGGGAINILFFDSNSMVVPTSTVVIGSNSGGFGTGLNDGDEFGGRESAVMGDIDGDGTLEIAVGAFQSEGGNGAIWILSLNPSTLEVVSKVRISPGESGFDENIPNDINPNGTLGGQFGHALIAVEDFNGDGTVDLFTGANQYGEGNAYILYMNTDKTVKSYTRINGSEGGFGLALNEEERFSRSISYSADSANPKQLTINVGGGASGAGGSDASGTIYQLEFKRCDFLFQGANTFWTGGNQLFSNWNHNDQLVTDPLIFEECTTKSFELDGNTITFNSVDGRCIVLDDNVSITDSTEGSTAYRRECQ